MAGGAKPEPEPTAAPPRVVLVIAPIPPPPPGSTPSETRRWQNLHQFRNTIDAIRRHLQLPGRRITKVNRLIRLYFNAYIATPGHEYRHDRSLRSRLSKDLRVEDNIHLATVGIGRGHTAKETLNSWNCYLRALGLPEVNRVGTGLPNNSRNRDGIAAALLMTLSSKEITPVLAAAGAPQAATQLSTSTIIVEKSTAQSGEANPFTAVFRTSRRRPAATDPFIQASSGDAVRRRALVEQVMNGVTEETDLDIHLILTSPRNLQTQGRETDRDAIIRLAIQFLDLQPSATARDAIIELARAEWDVEAALDSWSPDNGEEGGDGDEEGQPPKKRRRLDDDDGDDDEEGGHGGGKGKGKGKAKAKGKGKERAADE